MSAQVGPKALASDIDHHERGNRKNGPSHQRFAHRRRRAREVLLEHAAAEKRQAEKRDGDHRRRDGRRHRLPGLHAQVGVRCAEDCREQNTDQHGLQCELRLF